MDILITLFIAFVGGTIAMRLKVPAGALVGAMVAVAIYNVFTSQGNVPKNFKVIAQIVVGGMIGLNFTKESVMGLKDLVFPAVIVVIGLTILSLTLGFIIHKLTGLDLVTALFSSAPGGITDMTLMSEAYGAETHKVALLHLMRLITVITIYPIAINALLKFMKVK